MTYKSAVAGLPPRRRQVGHHRRPERGATARRCFRAHGRFVDTLGGRYITAEDVGTSSADMEFIHLRDRARRRPARACRAIRRRSPAYGVYMAMKAAAKARWGKDSLTGKTVAVQGAGKVAQYLARHLHEEGAKLHRHRHRRGQGAAVRRRDFGATAVAPDAIYDAAGRHLRALRARGHAQRPDDHAAQGRDHVRRRQQPARRAAARRPRVEKRGILYAPDYVINGGGVINVYGEIEGWSEERAQEEGGRDLRHGAPRRRRGPAREGDDREAADRLAEERLAAVRALREVRRR